MYTNAFRPPDSAPAPEEHDLLLKPVLLGLSIGAGTAYLVLAASGFVFVWWLVLTGTPVSQLYSQAYACVPYLLFSHALGLACMAVGGYWAMALAEHRGYVAPGVAGAVYALFVLMQFLAPYTWPVPFWSKALSVLLPLPGYLIGARIAFQRAQRSLR